jgi:hypothetical protein
MLQIQIHQGSKHLPLKQKLQLHQGFNYPPSQIEAPVSPGINPSSPQPEASNLPGTPPASPSVRSFSFTRNFSSSSSADHQKLPLEPERTPPPIQETRNEVSMGIQFCYSFSINYP